MCLRGRTCIGAALVSFKRLCSSACQPTRGPAVKENKNQKNRMYARVHLQKEWSQRKKRLQRSHTNPRAEPAMLPHRMEEIGPHFSALVQRTQRPRLLRARSTCTHTRTRGCGHARTRWKQNVILVYIIHRGYNTVTPFASLSKVFKPF